MTIPRSPRNRTSGFPYYDHQTMTEKRIPEQAPCGIWCGSCPSFGKTCNGCAPDDPQQDRKSKWRCRLRVCCYEKQQLDYCMDCEQFPCPDHDKKLIRSHPEDPRFRYRHEIPDNFRKLRELGTERYIQYQRKRFTCPECGGPVYWYHYTCGRCKNEVPVT